MKNNKVMSSCASGSKCQICNVDGGCCMKNRLADMGIFPGAFVEILRNEGGPVLVRIGQGRIALGRQMADKVWVA